MTLKSAALIAMVGTVLIAALMIWRLFFDIVNYLHGLVPAVALFSSFIYAFVCFSLALFFYVYFKAQA
jgi:hypothetical protein